MTVIDDNFLNELRDSKEGLACPICGAAMIKNTKHSPQVHHRAKRSRIGRYDVPEVCVVVCADCNLIKIECWSKDKFIEAYGQQKYDYYIKALDINEKELKKLYPDRIERRLYKKAKIKSGKMLFNKDSKWKKKLNGQVVRRH